MFSGGTWQRTALNSDSRDERVELWVKGKYIWSLIKNQKYGRAEQVKDSWAWVFEPKLLWLHKIALIKIIRNKPRYFDVYASAEADGGRKQSFEIKQPQKRWGNNQKISSYYWGEQLKGSFDGNFSWEG